MNEFRIFGFRFDRYGVAALVLAFALLFAAATDYIPAFLDSEGRVFGLFRLDIYKDALHVASGLWAFASAWSRRSAVFFLRVFGTLYFADGLVGVFTGSGYLDLSIFIDGVRDVSAIVKVLSSLPHLGLGALGIAVGWSPWRAHRVSA